MVQDECQEGQNYGATLGFYVLKWYYQKVSQL